MTASHHNSVLYEQVLVVNVFSYQGLCFCCCRCVCCCSPPGLYSHSDESAEVWTRCRLGFERRVDAAIYQTALEGQNAHAVIGTRCGWQRVNSMRLVERTGCTVAAWSKDDGARRPACVQRPRRTCSSPACRLWQPSAAPTVEVPSLDHGVAGCGWRTRSADFVDTRCRPW